MTIDWAILIDPRDFEEATRATTAFEHILSDPQTTHLVVLDPFFVRHMKFQFETSGRYGAQGWADHSGEKKYRAFKRAVAGHERPLEFGVGPNARLKNSLIHSNHPEHVFEARGKKASVGTRVPYAFDQTINRIGPFGERSPARDVISMTSRQEDELLRKLADDYDRRLTRSL